MLLIYKKIKDFEDNVLNLRYLKRMDPKVVAIKVDVDLRKGFDVLRMA
jgi:hypothetical protein